MHILSPSAAGILYSPLFYTSPTPRRSDTFKRGVTERGVFAFACQYIVSPRGRTGNRTVTQMRHPLLVEGRPNSARQSLASTVSAPRVAATSYCSHGRHANVITLCLLTPPFKRAQEEYFQGRRGGCIKLGPVTYRRLLCFTIGMLQGRGLEGWGLVKSFPVTPTPSTFSKVLRYEWEVFCRNGRRSINGRYIVGPFFQGFAARKVQ